MSSRFVLAQRWFNSRHFVSFDYTVCVLHHHLHFIDFGLVYER